MVGRATSVRRRLARTAGAASCVSRPLSFAAWELRGRPHQREYRLRGSDLRAVIRHPLLDLWVLEEIFRGGAYRLPSRVEERLRTLGRPPRVLDLGGHVGLFGLWLLGSFPDVKITSFEADPGNAASLRRCIESNGLEHEWNLVEAAASTTDGQATFLSAFQLSQVEVDPTALRAEHQDLERVFPFLRGRPLLEPREVTVETRDVFPWLRTCDFVKLDIQGGEWDLLLDPRFDETSGVALVLETHPASCPRSHPEEVVTERLEAAGFELEPRVQAHNRETVAWAVRSSGAETPGSR